MEIRHVSFKIFNTKNTLIEKGYEGFSFFEFGLIGLTPLYIPVIYFMFFADKSLTHNKTNNKPVDVDSTIHKWIEANKVDDYHRLLI